MNKPFVLKYNVQFELIVMRNLFEILNTETSNSTITQKKMSREPVSIQY